MLANHEDHTRTIFPCKIFYQNEVIIKKSYQHTMISFQHNVLKSWKMSTVFHYFPRHKGISPKFCRFVISWIMVQHSKHYCLWIFFQLYKSFPQFFLKASLLMKQTLQITTEGAIALLLTWSRDHMVQTWWDLLGRVRFGG